MNFYLRFLLRQKRDVLEKMSVKWLGLMYRGRLLCIGVVCITVTNIIYFFPPPYRGGVYLTAPLNLGLSMWWALTKGMLAPVMWTATYPFVFLRFHEKNMLGVATGPRRMWSRYVPDPCPIGHPSQSATWSKTILVDSQTQEQEK